jgi:hypothetical protein
MTMSSTTAPGRFHPGASHPLIEDFRSIAAEALWANLADNLEGRIIRRIENAEPGSFLLGLLDNVVEMVVADVIEQFPPDMPLRSFEFAIDVLAAACVPLTRRTILAELEGR